VDPDPHQNVTDPQHLIPSELGKNVLHGVVSYQARISLLGLRTMIWLMEDLVRLRQTERKMHKFATVKKFGEKKISSHSFNFMSMLRVPVPKYSVAAQDHV
jgi:hypothetical protein